MARRELQSGLSVAGRRLERAQQAPAFNHGPVVSNETPGWNRQSDLARARIAHRDRVQAANLMHAYEALQA